MCWRKKEANKSCIHVLKQNITFMTPAMQRIEFVPLIRSPRYSALHKLFPSTVYLLAYINTGNLGLQFC
jgi:hypothetical protein